jgi:GST-like protein
MIDLYYWPTPNGHKITLFLEETAMPLVSGGEE